MTTSDTANDLFGYIAQVRQLLPADEKLGSITASNSLKSRRDMFHRRPAVILLGMMVVEVRTWKVGEDGSVIEREYELHRDGKGFALHHHGDTLA